MNKEKEPRSDSSVVETVAGVGAAVGLAAVGASYIDAFSLQTGIDLLPGTSPLQSEDGSPASFKHVLRELQEPIDSSLNPEDYTTPQKISAWGFGLTLLAIFLTDRPFKAISVGGSATLGTFGGYKFLETLECSGIHDLSSLFVYGGSALAMYSTALFQLNKKRTDHLEKAQNIAQKFFKKKERKIDN